MINKGKIGDVYDFMLFSNTFRMGVSMDVGESSFVYFLNQDYAEEDEEDEFKVFFSCLSGKHA